MFNLTIEFRLALPHMLESLGGYVVGDKLDIEGVALRQAAIEMPQRMEKMATNVEKLQRRGWHVYLRHDHFECSFVGVDTLREGTTVLAEIDLDPIPGMFVVWNDEKGQGKRELPSC